ncbi:hypothetical protein JCM14635_39850 [Megalodesulfovibrio paquesii]
MGEKRKPMATLLLRKQGKESVKIEIFDGALFGHAGDYRLRVNGRFVSLKGQPFYHAADGVVATLRGLVFGTWILPEPEEEAPPAAFAPGDRVTVYYELAGVPRAEMGIVRSAPLQDQGGRQHVLVATGGPMRVALFPVEKVEVRE